ncbi:xanthine/uracil permease [Bradyrhizobium sp. USDA 4509]|uniref:Uncharacterized protein n=1 Tax=Bradyrhizobium brasilense TaxID=1419277 RepID=A0A1G7M957_9BRAD|nr:hypothetical protein SAMN05216337_10626 [Bradyrhizobium brasilense]
MDRYRHPWLRRFAIVFAILFGWLAVSVLFYQEGPDDRSLITSLLSGKL